MLSEQDLHVQIDMNIVRAGPKRSATVDMKVVRAGTTHIQLDLNVVRAGPVHWLRSNCDKQVFNGRHRVLCNSRHKINSSK